MAYNFDEIIDRNHTNSMNTDGFRQYIFHEDMTMKFPFADDEFIRMWIADMEFAAPDCVIEAIKERLNRRIFGYTRIFGDEYYRLFQKWCKNLYNWHFQKKDLFTSHGIIPALYELTGYICKKQKKDKVMMLTPSYAYFAHAAEHNEVEYVYSDLVNINNSGYYEVDYEDFRKKAEDPTVKLFILCNPHNPTGRIWKEEELRKMADICIENDVMIISDEIHCDLLRTGNRHIPLASLYPDSDRIITCMAPSKTFNMAGLQFSNVIIPDGYVKNCWMKWHNPDENPLSLAGAMGAYQGGYDWLQELKKYLDDNFMLVKTYFEEHLPKAVFRIPEATYLGWVNIESYLNGTENIPLLFAEKAGVLLEGGDMFVHNSETYIRLNVAIPRAILEEGLRRICKLLNDNEA